MTNTLGDFDIQNATIKAVANYIRVVTDHTNSIIPWDTPESEQQFITAFFNTLIELSVRQFDEKEIEYLQMRQRNGLFDMRG